MRIQGSDFFLGIGWRYRTIDTCREASPIFHYNNDSGGEVTELSFVLELGFTFYREYDVLPEQEKRKQDCVRSILEKLKPQWNYELDRDCREQIFLNGKFDGFVQNLEGIRRSLLNRLHKAELELRHETLFKLSSEKVREALETAKYPGVIDQIVPIYTPLPLLIKNDNSKLYPNVIASGYAIPENRQGKIIRVTFSHRVYPGLQERPHFLVVNYTGTKGFEFVWDLYRPNSNESIWTWIGGGKGPELKPDIPAEWDLS